MLMSFDATHLYISLTVLAVVLIVLWMQKRSLSYIFFCAIFGIYLVGVISVVVFPIHIPEMGMEFNRRLQVNLVPFNFGRCGFLYLCIRNIYENILLTIPFGFGVSFIARLKPKNIFWLAIAVGCAFELVQLIISLAIRSSFRVVDINDVILNATGVLLGYGIFTMFGRLYLFIMQRFHIQPKYILAYIHDVVTPHVDHRHPSAVCGQN